MLATILELLAANPGTSAVLLPLAGSILLEVLKRYSPGLANALGWIRNPVPGPTPAVPVVPVVPVTPPGIPPDLSVVLAPLLAFFQKELQAVEARLLARLLPAAPTPTLPPTP